MKKFLIPIDGSETSMKALNTGLQMAKDYNAEVCILSIVEDKALYTAGTNIGGGNTQIFANAKEIVLEHERANCQAMLDACVKDFADAGIKAETLLVIGSPHEEIIAAAEQKNCDMIIIGCRGLTATKRFILGSVSEKVVFRAKCNVLVVK